jgi:biotin operon repressor
LAARIDQLRKEGMDIETVTQTRNGKRYAAYVLRGQASLPFEARA